MCDETAYYDTGEQPAIGSGTALRVKCPAGRWTLTRFRVMGTPVSEASITIRPDLRVAPHTSDVWNREWATATADQATCTAATPGVVDIQRNIAMYTPGGYFWLYPNVSAGSDNLVAWEFRGLSGWATAGTIE